MVDPFHQHTISVITKTLTENASHQPITTTNPPVNVIGKMRQLSASEKKDEGIEVNTAFSFSTRRSYPGGSISDVTWLDPELGILRRFRGNTPNRAVFGMATSNTRVIMEEIDQDLF